MFKPKLLNIAFLFFFGGFSTLFAQQNNFGTFPLKGFVKDAETKEPLIGVHIRIPTSSLGTISFSDGDFEMPVKKFPITLVFSYLGYHSKTITIEKRPAKPLVILMKRNAEDLPEIVISAKPKIEEITPNSYSVMDFLIFENRILLLTYHGTFANRSLQLIDYEGNTLAKVKLKGLKKIEGLHKSCLDGMHILTRFDVYQVFKEGENLVLGSPHSREKYEEIMRPCVLSNEDYVYYVNENFKGQSLFFTGFPREGGKAFRFGKTMDAENVSRYFEELAAIEYHVQQANAGAVQDPVALGKIRDMEAMVDGWAHLFYKKIKVQLESLHESLILFNHLDNQLEYYDYDGTFQNLISIDYSKDKNWDGIIFKDIKTGQFYTRFEHKKGKTISQINLDNGEIQYSILVECYLIERMAIHDGILYYLESGVTETARNRILHKVKIF